MTASSSDPAWEDDIVRGLHSVTSDQVPALEIILLDALVDWLYSPANPGENYDESHAGHLVSTLFTAIDSSRAYLPAQEPTATESITAVRTRVVDGAHELSAQGPDGVTTIVSRLIPALLAELQNNIGERAKQAHRVWVYSIYTLALGTRTEHDHTLMEGVAATFAGWDDVLRSGFVVPWRRAPDA
ncbi:MAG: hypothetical protein L0I24_20230 [Pseudonocardia sp.]|nr:hypothetical protein [Pseudonocardia sp.]